MGSPEDFSDQLERAKRASMAQLLFRCARLLNERALARARERLQYPVRASHMTLIPHIDLQGTRLTTLARRVGVSKQAVGQLVGELEGFGALERVPDPDDGRAKLVRFTEAGRRWLLEGLAVLGEVELELGRQLGHRHIRTLHTALLALLDILEPREQDPT